MREARDRVITRIAAGQRTIVSAEQLYARGITKRAIEYRVKAGRMRVVFRGAYSYGCGELPPLAREQAALLVCGTRAFLSHATAAAIWGLIAALPAEIEVSVVGPRCASRKGIRVHRIKTIDRREVRRHEDLLISAPARAVLELAAAASAKELAAAIDEGLARRLFSPRDLDDVLARNRPCRGAARLAAILADPTATSVSRSQREKQLLRLIRDAGLPQPETNVPFGRFELDFFWPREGLVVELDGYNFHRGPVAFGRDREKELAVRATGLDMLRFTGDHVLKRSWMVVATIAGGLERRRGNS